jgi:hypothetical protein
MFMFIHSGLKARRAERALHVSWPFIGWSTIMAGILFLALIQQPLQATQSVILAWQPSSDPNAVGYRIYYGTASGNYTEKVYVGNLTGVTIDGLADGVTYYFAATTFNAQNQESGFSNEASYQVPAAVITNAAPNIQIQRTPAGQFMLTAGGPAGQRLVIEATQDFKAWIIIGTATVGTSGSANFTDFNAMNFPQRFYRIQPIRLPKNPNDPVVMQKDESNE